MKIIPILVFFHFAGQTGVFGQSGKRYGNTKFDPTHRAQVFPDASAMSEADADKWIKQWGSRTGVCYDVINNGSILEKPIVAFSVVGDVIDDAAAKELKAKLEVAEGQAAHMEAQFQETFKKLEDVKEELTIAKEEAANAKRQLAQLEAMQTGGNSATGSASETSTSAPAPETSKTAETAPASTVAQTAAPAVDLAKAKPEGSTAAPDGNAANAVAKRRGRPPGSASTPGS